eukprot:6787490-Prymnesium_polylepis.1
MGWSNPSRPNRSRASMRAGAGRWRRVACCEAPTRGSRTRGTSRKPSARPHPTMQAAASHSLCRALAGASPGWRSLSPSGAEPVPISATRSASNFQLGRHSWTPSEQ